MLRFFRNLRKSIIETVTNHNSFSISRKYLLYAIGEIVLVMIGILLALQVNNWNELRKDRIKEKYVLLEILNSINNDLDVYDRAFDYRLEGKRNGIDSLLYYHTYKLSIHEDSLMKHYYAMRRGPILRFDSGPYDALKSAGLETILNDSLRTVINYTFGSSLPAQVMFAQRARDFYEPQIAEIENRIMKVKVIQDVGLYEDGLFETSLIPGVEDILQNEDFLKLVRMELSILHTENVRLRAVRNQMNYLKKKIETEINQKQPDDHII